jgi:NAD(P)-dependent dehydrogenase (short-subunit alcohol dehydrogenase family)
MDDLRGKVAVVTGGASGIGKAMAARFASEGTHVVIADVEVGALDAAAAELGVMGVRTDVSDAASVAALADAVVDRFGAVHLLCNNAGVGGGGPIRDISLKEWQWVLGVNLWGVIHGLHAFLPHLLANEDGGHVVNTASMAGLLAGAGLGPYCASKHAVVSISESLAAELAADGSKVGVTVVCPGWVRTGIFTSERNRPESLRDAPGEGADGGPLSEADLLTIVADQTIEPEVVADQVLAAVRARRFWVVTHPDMVAIVDANHHRLMEAAGLA